MNMNKKKKYYLVKDSSYDYKNDLFIYELSNTNCLDDYIKNISDLDNISIFKYNLDKCISIFFSSFYFLQYKKIYFKISIQKNPIIFDFINHYYCDDIIYKKSIIYNFYKNLMFIYDGKKGLFQKLNINKNLNLNKKEDLELLYSLMINIIRCNAHLPLITYFFENYDELLSKKQQYDFNILKKYKKGEIYYNICDIWELLINNYIKNK